MSGRLTQFLGDSPLKVLLRLVVLSFIVGLILSAVNLDPWDIYSWIERMIRRIWAMGFDFVEEGLGYLIVGAIIVIPVFLLMRLFRMGGGGRRAD
jgi:hypothetical protein